MRNRLSIDAAESHLLRYMQCCESGSGRIRTILPHLDPDRYQFQANDKVDKKKILFQIFQYAVKFTDNYDKSGIYEKNKYCKLVML